MEQIKYLIDVFLHLNHHIADLTAACGLWTYAIVFLIIFAETGLVIIPFLPGDSLLFVLGAVAAQGTLNLGLLWVLLTVAAIVGDALNYSIGALLRNKILNKQKIGFIKPEHLAKTHAFYEKHGNKTIILARFVPLVRTFAPFLAGVAAMSYRKFALYNVVGALLWVTIGLGAGWLFGSLPWVEENFSLVILVIVVVSLVPAVIEFLKHKKQR